MHFISIKGSLPLGVRQEKPSAAKKLAVQTYSQSARPTVAVQARTDVGLPSRFAK